jgi:DNA-binding LacI/PurR family transcriptional regulator
MHDVARLAGVSHQTVSRVLNNHPSVRPVTRQRVQHAIEILDYHPNPLARGLVTRRSGLLGVIAIESARYGPASSLSGIEKAARAAGFATTISVMDATPPAVHSAEEALAGQIRATVRALASQAVEGVVVIAPTDATARSVRALRADLPIVAIEASVGGDVPLVSIDQVRGARSATEHLLRLGHRTVWHVAGPHDWTEARQRVEGWRQALTKAEVAAPPVIHGDWSPAAGFRAGVELIEQSHNSRFGLTAVFAANDHMALGLIQALHQAGLRVPQDVSIVGFDDIPEAPYLLPPLTTVNQDFYEMGRRGLELLTRLIACEPVESCEPMTPTFVVRESTAPPTP